MAAGARVLDALYISGYGTAAASGSISFYQVGTLVPIVVYSDDTLLTAQSQPIVLDSSGKTPLPVYTATPARCIIKASSGATLADIARVDGDRAELVGVANTSWTATDLNSVLTAIQSSVGGIDAKFLDAGAGAVPRTIQAKFSEVQRSVKDFGTVGNGIADDTAAIQATINAVKSAGGGTVYLPPGTYKITSTLTVSTASIIITGAGIGTSIISNAGAGSVITESAGNYRLFLRDFQISGGSSAGSGVVVATVGGTYIERVYIDGIAKAVSGASTGTIYVSASTLIGTTTGVDTNGTIYATSTTFTGASTHGLTVTGSSGVLAYLTNCTLSGGTFGLNIGANIGLIAAASAAGFGSPGLNIAVGAAEVISGGCDWGTVTDGRTGAPVNYVFAGANNMTPLPMQASVIRVEQQTGAVVTTINNIAALEFGRTFTLICTNTSAGASNFTFGANYVLSAAVAPASGNRIALHLYYDPRTSKVYEDGRGVTAN